MAEDSQAGASSSFTRAPLSSAPAQSVITQLQISLNNLSSQVCEAVYVVAENAPPLPFAADAPRSKFDLAAQSRTNFEIVRRSQQINTIIQAVRKLVDQLPDSSRKEEDAEREIRSLQALNQQRTEELRRLRDALRPVQLHTAAAMADLTEELRNEERTASLW